MNAFKIWIATHPNETHIQEFSITEPSDHSVMLYSINVEGDEEWVRWVEHICIPIQE